MTISLFGGEIGICVPSDANIAEGNASLGGAGDSYDSGFARCYLNCVASASYALTPALPAALTDFWLHIEVDQYNASASSTQRTLFEILDGSGVAKIRLQCAKSDDLWQFQYNNGSWVTFGGATFSADGETKQTIDIHVVCNTASGSGHLYMSGTNRVAATSVDLSTITGLSQLKMYGNTFSINGNHAFSQIVIANESTIGMRVGTIYMSGAGATDQWTGTYTDVDEIIYSDADFIYAASADLVDLYTGTSVPAFTGYTIRAIAVTARVKKGSSGPTQVQLALRSGSTTYFSGSKALDLAYGSIWNVWETNPDTSAAWLSTAISSLQYGLKSIT